MRKFLVAVLLCSCGGEIDLSASSDEVAPRGPDTVIVAVDERQTAQVRLRAAEHTVWVDPILDLDGGSWRMLGRTSRNLEEAVAYVPEDGFGDASVISARRFEVRLDRGHEINSMLSGLPLFVQLGTSANHAVGLWFVARFTGFSGNRGLFLESSLIPIYVRDPVDNLRYRAIIELDRAGCQVNVPNASVQALDDDSFAADFTFDEVRALAEGGRVQVTASCGSTTLRKSATVKLGLMQAGLTVRSPEREWARDVCLESVRDCILALGPDATDLGACGPYREAQLCELVL